MTADTYSTDGIGVLLMGTGNDNNAWGVNANANVFQYLVDSITNTLTSAVTGGTLDLSGTPPPTASSQVRYAGLIFTGVLASNQILQVPNLNKWWLVKNATSGAFTLKIKTSGGSASTAIPQNSGWQMVQCDGANGIVVWPFNTSQIQMPDGSVSAPPYSNITEPTSGWRRAGTQDWRLVINGADVVSVTAAGASSPNLFTVLAPLTAVFTFADAAITYAKIQNVAAGKFLGNIGSAAAAVSEQIVPFGQCQLTKSGSNLLLSPYGGNLLTNNSQTHALPDAGVTLSTGGLSANTAYYIYAIYSAGTWSMEASATVPAVQAGTGVKIKNGDATRTLVGQGRTNGSTAWVDSATQRFVRSWFNDPGIALIGSATNNKTTTSNSYVQLTSEIFLEFLSWTNEIAHFATCGTVSAGAGQSASSAIAFNSTTTETVSASSSTTSAVPIGMSVTKSDLTEGYNYCTINAHTGGSVTATWSIGFTLSGSLRRTG